ncbi:Lrp/AsnC family transcriptional regulator [Streptomyces sp. NBC_00006]|uniref:Lrp/AsnC family transcriptional regulator n=1 Tax=Streptomyces sp. NBC_00006 TaxID=2975619 RepID=UPI002250A613|nr:Lrp/AsnC family transcriptional regulator [Streptomyces sp. NBC_00006]MCX5529758.1 Lrp/AsnC family transcriptional regulator [Streptomyces sp. NBC_00006]
MDDTDRGILRELAVDARASLEHLARASGLAASSVKRRIARLEETGVIRGYTVRVDQRQLGLGVQALIGLYVAPSTSRAELTDSLNEQEEIVRAWTTAGNADAQVLVQVRDTDHLEQVILRLQQMPGFAHTRTQILLTELVHRAS